MLDGGTTEIDDRRASEVVKVSAIPTPRCAFEGSLPRLVSGRTAITGRSARATSVRPSRLISGMAATPRATAAASNQGARRDTRRVFGATLAVSAPVTGDAWL